jgi:hypothetical protein
MSAGFKDRCVSLFPPLTNISGTRGRYCPLFWTGSKPVASLLCLSGIFFSITIFSHHFLVVIESPAGVGPIYTPLFRVDTVMIVSSHNFGGVAGIRTAVKNFYRVELRVAGTILNRIGFCYAMLPLHHDSKILVETHGTAPL